jgi:hypothetical protein
MGIDQHDDDRVIVKSRELVDCVTQRIVSLEKAYPPVERAPVAA